MGIQQLGKFKDLSSDPRCPHKSQIELYTSIRMQSREWGWGERDRLLGLTGYPVRISSRFSERRLKNKVKTWREAVDTSIWPARTGAYTGAYIHMHLHTPAHV